MLVINHITHNIHNNNHNNYFICYLMYYIIYKFVTNTNKMQHRNIIYIMQNTIKLNIFCLKEEYKIKLTK